MNIADVKRSERAFSVTWGDQSVTQFPFIWLRDNDRDELHPQTRERTFDLTSVNLDICPDAFDVRPDRIEVRWPGCSVASIYEARWLHAHRPGQARHDAARVERCPWDGHELREIPRVDAGECARSPEALLNALLRVKRIGLILVEGLADDVSAGEAFADLIGFKRKTNFGVMFEVVSEAQPNNLAYTALALPLHTDLANQEAIPGYQFLHSFRNSATGGESVFADGLRICDDFEKQQPREFELLKRIAIPWRFHDEDNDIRQHRPIIGRRDNGDFDCFVFNAHISDVPDMETEILYEFYAAYRALMTQVRDSKYAVRYALRPGEMAVFDNRRVLHGRTAFDPTSGTRHYRGYYIEHNEIDSRIRVLSRATPGPN